MSNVEIILNKLIEQNAISISTLARQTGIGQSVIHRLATGETSNPKLDTLKPIAKYFTVSLDQLIGNEPLANKNKEAKAYSLPLLAMDQIVPWLQNKDKFTELTYLAVADAVLHDNCYAVQIQDATMHPRFAEGTYFVFDPNLAPKNGDCVAFTKGENEIANIRQLLIDNEDRYLKALNRDFRTISMNQDYKILGTAIQARTNYKDLARVVTGN